MEKKRINTVLLTSLSDFNLYYLEMCAILIDIIKILTSNCYYYITYKI